MDRYIKFINENFTPTVSEVNGGMCVILKNNEDIIPESKVWFELAKRGWSKKPISNNVFVITDVYVIPLLDFMDKYMGLKEDDYDKVRTSIINYSTETINKHIFKG